MTAAVAPAPYQPPFRSNVCRCGRHVREGSPFCSEACRRAVHDRLNGLLGWDAAGE